MSVPFLVFNGDGCHFRDAFLGDYVASQFDVRVIFDCP